MSLTASLAFVSRWFRRSDAASREQEPADLGTAFGLECWLDEDPQDPAAPGGAAALDANGLPRWLYSVGRD